MVSVSGVRGIVGHGLTPELVLAYAAALATRVHGQRVVVGRDSRPSGDMLRRAVIAGLQAGGCEVIDLGIVPTPTCGRAVSFQQAAGGIMITASHNPAPWNGLKIFGADGAVLPAADGKIIQEIFEKKDFRCVEWDGLRSIETRTDALTDHVARVVALVDAKAIRQRRVRVFLDTNHGAGGPLSVSLLNELGCEVVAISNEPNGRFEHEPEPIPENLATVSRQAATSRADIGFALDPDADRLAILDEAGRCIGEELTLALAAKFRLSQQRGPIAANVSSSRVLDDIAGSFGVVCKRTAVGEANVVAGMRAANAVIGGEGNGGVIDPRVGWVRDPFIGMSLVLNLLANSGKKTSELVAELPRYEIVKTKFAVDRTKLPDLFDAMLRKWPEAKTNQLDGLRLDWTDRWLHVRPSNTEPVVRAIAEAPRREDAEALCQAAAAITT
jgi:phosphomannomutase